MQINDLPIGVFDSGIGGLNVLNYLSNAFKNESFVYYGDNLNAPYGNKSLKELKRLTINCVKKLMDFKVKAIVVACNTLSTNCFNDIVEFSKLDVIGTFPKIVNDNNAVLLCTNKTAQSSYVLNNFNKDAVIPLTTLAKNIENSIRNGKTLNLETELPKFKKVPNSIILGCTHYVFLKNQFISTYKCNVYDGLDDVSSRLNKVLLDKKSNNVNPKIYFIGLTAKRNFCVYNKVFGGCKSHKVVIVPKKIKKFL